MVSRGIKYTALTAMILIMLFAAFFGWVVSTEQGSAWFVRITVAQIPLQSEFSGIKGTLLRRMEISHARTTWAGGSASTEKITFSWRPVRLFIGQLSIPRLIVTRPIIHLQMTPPAKNTTHDLLWPDVSWLPTHLHATIDNILIDDITIFFGDDPPKNFEKVEATLTWRIGTMTLPRFRVIAREFKASGKLTLGFRKQFAEASISLEAQEIQSPISHLTVNIAGKTDSPVFFKGNATVLATTSKYGTLQVQSPIIINDEAFCLTDISLLNNQKKGKISGNIQIPRKSPLRIQGKLLLHKIPLLAQNRAVVMSGTTNFAWQQGKYRGDATLVTEGEGWRRGTLATYFSGSAQEATLSKMQGSALGGTFGGTLHIAWKEPFTVSGTLRINEFNPVAIHRSLPGAVTMTLTGTAIYGTKGFSLTSVAMIDESRIREASFHGKIAAAYSDGEITLRHLELTGDSFDLSAHGSLRQRIDVDLLVKRLQIVDKSLEGNLATKGWFSLRNGIATGSLVVSGADVKHGEISIGEFSMNVERTTTHPPSMTIVLNGENIVIGPIDLTQANLSFSGSPADHRLEAEVTWNGGKAKTSLDGSLAGTSWKGTISSISATDPYFGTWHLSGPTKAALSNSHINIDPMSLQGSRGETFTIEADLGLKPLAGTINSSWNYIDISTANRFLTSMLIDGKTSGMAAITWIDGKPEAISVRADLATRVSLENNDLAIDHGALSANWIRSGLSGSLSLALAAGGTLEGTIKSDDRPQLQIPPSGRYGLDWKGFDLALLQILAPEVETSGISSGRVIGAWHNGKPSRLAGMVEASGTVITKGHALDFSLIDAELDWDERGMYSLIKAEMAGGGEVTGTISSSTPVLEEVPQQGNINATWENLNLSLFQSFIPKGLRLEGLLNGTASGKILAKSQIELTGSSSILNGIVRWSTREGELSTSLKVATTTWQWHGKEMTGLLDMNLERLGVLHGSFRLPLTAELPPRIVIDGPLDLSLEGRVEEHGLVAAILPATIAESHGRLSTNLRITGTVKNPAIDGHINLIDAGGMIPGAGITLSGVEADVRFSGDSLFLDYFRIGSGQGEVEGAGSIAFSDWGISSFNVEIIGDRFQALHLPELQLEVSPSLTISGTNNLLVARGIIVIPELLVQGQQQKPARASEDVIIIDQRTEETGRHQFPLDIQVKVILGDKVLLDAQGINAQLGGAVELAMTSAENILGRGNIRVLKGSYSAYGVKLDITKGTVHYAGGSIKQPTLDIVALRTIKRNTVMAEEAGPTEKAVEPEEVKAGVQITGTPQAPVVRLYSVPGMPETDIISYIVLGHPLGADPSQVNLLMLTAGALLSRGESFVLQDRLKRAIGVDVLQVESGGSDVSQSILTVGKYLNPKLFVSYGRYLFTGENELRLRYNISKHWEVESKRGTETGADLYYRIEFR